MKKFLLVLTLVMAATVLLPLPPAFLPEMHDIKESKLNNLDKPDPVNSKPSQQTKAETAPQDAGIPARPKAGISTETASGPAAAETAPSQSARQEQLHKQPAPVKQRNSRTDNLNILFVGAQRDKLLMTAVYSINYQDREENFKSGSVFLPGDMQVAYDGRGYLLQELFKDLGKDNYGQAAAKILEKLMDISIAYHVIIDKEVLAEAEKILDPIILDGKRINLEDIFEMPASDKDRFILGQLMEQFTTPAAFFYKLPALVFKSSRHIKTDFPLTPENLWLHFRIARNVNTGEIDKVILDKNTPDEILKDIIYKITTHKPAESD